MVELVRVCDNTVPAGNQVTNTTAKTYLTNSWYLPANTDSGSNTGRIFDIEVLGNISNAAVTPGTLTITINIGTTAIVSSTAIVLPTGTPLSNSGFYMKAKAILCASGTSGKWSAQGFIIIDDAGVAITSGMVNTGTGTTGQTTINTQNSATLQIGVQFSFQSASNVFTATQVDIRETA